MATLTPSDIKNILLTRPNKQLIIDGEAMHKKLSIHINGIGIADYLEQIETYEKQDALVIRKKYARSNIDLFSRLLRPVDKVFCARGGGRYYKLPTTEQEKAFDQQLLDVENGYSSKKWVETFWKPRYHDDPMGLVFMEVGKNEVYPTYKAITDIFDYKPDGRKLEYVVFRTEDPQVFRIVDDTYDMTYKVEGEKVKKVGETYNNYFGYVPGLIISDIPKAGFEDLYASPVDPIVELADEYLRDGSIRNVYKFKHGFPKSWKYREMCGDCKGTGARGSNPCTTCNGTGKKLDSSVSEIMVLDWPTANDQVIAPNVAGYITPALDYLKYAREELTYLEDLMNKTHWGSSQVAPLKNGNPETATGRFIDAQPVNERLASYADAAEKIEKFIVDAIGQFTYQTEYKGCTITYGRRFLVEGPDVLWKKYEDSRKSGAPLSILDEQLKEYLESKFQANTMELQKYLRMMRIEPFPHMTVDEVSKIVSGVELARKAYFTEWAGTVREVDWLVKKDVELKDSLTEFASKRYVAAIPAPTPNPAPAPAPAGMN